MRKFKLLNQNSIPNFFLVLIPFSSFGLTIPYIATTKVQVWSLSSYLHFNKDYIFLRFTEMDADVVKDIISFIVVLVLDMT